jgi:hypothetical protein
MRHPSWFLVERILFQLKDIKGKMTDAVPENEISDGAEAEKNWWDEPDQGREVSIGREVRVNLLRVQMEPSINRACCNACPQPRAMHLMLTERDFVAQRSVFLKMVQFSIHG